MALDVGRTFVWSEFHFVKIRFEEFRVVAVSAALAPYPVLVYDVNSRQQIANCMGHRREIRGLACLPSTASSNPRIVSGGYGRGQVLVFDAFEGTKLCVLPGPPFATCRILHVPVWNSHPHVFVGGMGSVVHYDLNRPDRKIGSFAPLRRSFVDDLRANVSENILLSTWNDQKLRMWSRDYSCQRTIPLPVVRGVCVIDEWPLLGLDNVALEERLAYLVEGIEACHRCYVSVVGGPRILFWRQGHENVEKLADGGVRTTTTVRLREHDGVSVESAL